MAYYNGTAVDMTALRAALVAACTDEGWSWNASTEVLSKSGLFLRLQIAAGYLTALGRTEATAGDAPNVVRVGQIGTTPITYPLTYELFIFAGEVFLVINYAVDFYQWLAFGLSTVEGLSGSGMWLGASGGGTNDVTSAGIVITGNSGGAIGPDRTSGALFWSTTYTNVGQLAHRNAFVHSALDGDGWALNNASASAVVGIQYCVPLIGLLPNSWNSEAVLLPIRAYKMRPSAKISLVADVANARHTRVDNYSPGEILTVGEDRWKIFPWLRKDVPNRTGITVSTGAPHSGTFGWAIRYEGP